MLNKVKILKEIKKHKAKKIFVQIPEGLKTKALDLVGFLEKNGLTVYLSAETCYGACDLRDREAELLGCDLILHLGHSDMGIKTNTPVVYYEVRINYNPVPVLKKYTDLLKPYEKISLLTTVQFLSALEKAKEFLEKQGKTILMKKPNKAKYPGQVLGCDYSAAVENADCFLFIGSGEFHPLGLAERTEKPVFFLDVEKGIIKRMENRLYRIKFAGIEKCKELKRFGILVSVKPGQFNPNLAERIKKVLESKGKKAWILVFDEITPEKIMGLGLECLVNCACPRITEDVGLFKKPVLGPEDVEKL